MVEQGRIERSSIQKSQEAFENLVRRFESDFKREPERIVVGHVVLNHFTYLLMRLPSESLKSLTQRQSDVAKMAAAGYSLDAIALKLGISRSCVAKHLQRAYEKLQVHSRAELGRVMIGLT